MTTPKISLSNELQAQVEQLALAQSRQPFEVLEDAVRKYLSDQKWQLLSEEGERRAREKGYTEADVPRLIDEVRQENRVRER